MGELLSSTSDFLTLDYFNFKSFVIQLQTCWKKESDLTKYPSNDDEREDICEKKSHGQTQTSA